MLLRLLILLCLFFWCCCSRRRLLCRRIRCLGVHGRYLLCWVVLGCVGLGWVGLCPSLAWVCVCLSDCAWIFVLLSRVVAVVVVAVRKHGIRTHRHTQTHTHAKPPARRFGWRMPITLFRITRTSSEQTKRTPRGRENLTRMCVGRRR